MSTLNSEIGNRSRSDITSNLTNLPAAISEQNLFKYGYKIGDYFTGPTAGYTYYLGDMNTYMGTSTSCINTSHIGIVVVTHTTSQWYTGSAASVGYNGSTLQSYLEEDVLTNIQSDFTALFGDWSSHLLSHNKLFTIATAGWNWQSSKYISALTCTQVDAGSQWSANGFQEGEASKSLEIFRKYKWTEIFGDEAVWLRPISNYDSSALYACSANSDGRMSGNLKVTTALSVAGLICMC